MRLRTLARIALSDAGPLFVRVQRLLDPVYRAAFVAGAARAGVLSDLAAGPVHRSALLGRFSPRADTQDAFLAWLRFGERIGEIQVDEQGLVSLHGPLAKALASVDHDPIITLVEEVVDLHVRMLLLTPTYCKEGRKFENAVEQTPLLARPSEALEPFIADAIDEVVPRHRPTHLLEVGAGSGATLRYGCERNPSLTAVSRVDDADEVRATRDRLAAWGLTPRVRVERSEDAPPGETFDVICLHNRLFRVPLAERAPRFASLKGLLRPGGRLLVTSGCQGGSPGMHALDLWASSTAGSDRLPTRDEVLRDLKAAGFADVRVRRLVPGETYSAFVAANDPPARVVSPT